METPSSSSARPPAPIVMNETPCCSLWCCGKKNTRHQTAPAIGATSAISAVALAALAAKCWPILGFGAAGCAAISFFSHIFSSLSICWLKPAKTVEESAEMMEQGSIRVDDSIRALAAHLLESEKLGEEERLRLQELIEHDQRFISLVQEEGSKLEKLSGHVKKQTAEMKEGAKQFFTDLRGVTGRLEAVTRQLKIPSLSKSVQALVNELPKLERALSQATHAQASTEESRRAFETIVRELQTTIEETAITFQRLQESLVDKEREAELLNNTIRELTELLSKSEEEKQAAIGKVQEYLTAVEKSLQERAP